MTENRFFTSLDAGFIGINLDHASEPLVWKCDGISVQHRFELPIPSLAGAICKYRYKDVNIYVCLYISTCV